MLARESEAALATPDQADDLHGLLERLQRLARRPPGSAISLDGVPEGPRPEPQLETPPGEQVDAGGSLGQHRRRAQRKTGDIGEQLDPLGGRTDGGDEGKGVDEPPLVGMVLDPQVVETHVLSPPGDVQQRIGGVGNQEVAEFEGTTGG
jgi:hypothetical protein